MLPFCFSERFGLVDLVGLRGLARSHPVFDETTSLIFSNF